MRTTKSTIKTEVIYDDEMKNKYLIRKEWDKNKKKALVVMKNAGQADEIIQDQFKIVLIIIYVNHKNNLYKSSESIERAEGVKAFINIYYFNGSSKRRNSIC